MQNNSESLLRAVLEAKCPACRQGSIFKYPVWQISKFADTHKSCPSCGMRFEREPGFFYGAMYISYVFSTGIFLVMGFLTYWFANNPPVWVYVLVVLITSLVLSPFSLRYSRVLMLYLFGGVTYHPLEEGNNTTNNQG
ncbi:MAG TPA: DUF983 domain-containing protein [Microscillaceae bacterium]|jgi:uncharacterized protein (DUF983 family)|nr:DUF983 domain-containing protein [Microscillaceae bacterium]